MIGNMDKKSFFLGTLTGAAVAFAGLVVIGLAYNKKPADGIQYLESPVSYENKSEAEFEVLQVLDHAALAHEREIEIRIFEGTYCTDTLKQEKLGKTVLLLGDGFYSDQTVKVKNPQRTGTFSYENKGGKAMAVPVITGEVE